MRFDGSTPAAPRGSSARGHTEGLALSARFLPAEGNGAISCNFFLVTKISLWVFGLRTRRNKGGSAAAPLSSLRRFRGHWWRRGGHRAAQGSDTVWERLAVLGTPGPWQNPHLRLPGSGACTVIFLLPPGCSFSRT